MHKRFPLVHITGRAVWLPTRFLENTIGHLVKALVSPQQVWRALSWRLTDIQQVPAFVKEYIKKLDASFQEHVFVFRSVTHT